MCILGSDAGIYIEAGAAMPVYLLQGYCHKQNKQTNKMCVN